MYVYCMYVYCSILRSNESVFRWLGPHSLRKTQNFTAVLVKKSREKRDRVPLKCVLNSALGDWFAQIIHETSDCFLKISVNSVKTWETNCLNMGLKLKSHSWRTHNGMIITRRALQRANVNKIRGFTDNFIAHFRWGSYHPAKYEKFERCYSW